MLIIEKKACTSFQIESWGTYQLCTKMKSDLIAIENNCLQGQQQKIKITVLSIYFPTEVLQDMIQRIASRKWTSIDTPKSVRKLDNKSFEGLRLGVKTGHTKLPSKSYKKILKQPNFFHSQPSTLPKDTPAKVNLSTTFGLSFMISSVAHTWPSTFNVYLITKIGNRNLNPISTGGSFPPPLCFLPVTFFVLESISPKFGNFF